LQTCIDPATRDGRRTADAVLTAHICQSHATLNLAQHAHDLGFCKSALPHQNLLVGHSEKILPSKPFSLGEDYPAGTGQDDCHGLQGSRDDGTKLRDECLNGEIFYSLREAQVVIEKWRIHYNTKRPHSALGYRPPAPLTIAAKPTPLDEASLMQ